MFFSVELNLDAIHDQVSWMFKPARSGDLAAFDGIPGIRVARCGDVPRGYEGVDKFLVLGSEFELQRWEVTFPLCLCTGSGDGRADRRVLENPCECESHRGGAPLFGVARHGLCDAQGLGTPFGLLDALVSAAGARVRCGRC